MQTVNDNNGNSFIFGLNSSLVTTINISKFCEKCKTHVTDRSVEFDDDDDVDDDDDQQEQQQQLWKTHKCINNYGTNNYDPDVKLYQMIQWVVYSQSVCPCNDQAPASIWYKSLLSTRTNLPCPL